MNDESFKEIKTIEPDAEDQNAGEELESLEERLRYLQRLQTAGRIDNEEWDINVHFPEMQRILERISEITSEGPLTEEEVDRLKKINLKQIGENLTDEELKERDTLESRKKEHGTI